MGLSFSCPFAACTDLEISPTAIAFEDNEAKSLVRSISFKIKNQDSVMQSLTSQKMKTQESFHLQNPSQVENESRLEDMIDENPGSPEHEAAIKLQKVYKSFRTRRKLADCAVLIEQSWWKLLDFAELRRSSISFFDIDKHETAVSRWSRARTRAAKVGKGLSQNSKAQKLALQHWLEAIDPRHRYGHNLHFYYLKWLHSQSKEPFFYWLDIGEGKEVNLSEKCPRSKLQQQCIKYLGPMERKVYEVVIEDGKLVYKQTGEFIDTKERTKGAKWIFVLSTYKTLYVGIKKKGSFQHSSFLAGGATLAAGRIIAEKGVLKAIWPHSGHYHPTPENFQCFVAFLKENGVDTTYVKMDADDGDDKESLVKQNSIGHIRTHSSEEDMSEKDHIDPEGPYLEDDHTPETPKRPSLFGNFTELTTLEIPKNNDLLMKMITHNQDYSDDEDHEPVPSESILKRIDSHKETGSFQLGRQLSCKWSTGAGPRIGCLRDYPTELQSHALERVKLFPRRSKSCLTRRNSLVYRTQSSLLSV